MRGLRWILVSAFLATGACGGGTNPVTDSGPGNDSGPVTPGNDAGPEMLPVATSGGPGCTSQADCPDGRTCNMGLGVCVGPADLSCVGAATAPMPGEMAVLNIHAYDFQSGAGSNIANMPIEIFPDNVVTEGCSGTCVQGTTDAMGIFPATLAAGGWFAYRIAADTDGDPVLTVGYNQTAEAAGTRTNVASVSDQTTSLVSAVYLRTRIAGTGIVAAGVYDCMGNNLGNAQLRLFRGDQELVPGPGRTDLLVGYFMGVAPNRFATRTDNRGILAAANVPVEGGPVRMEVWAVRAEGQEPERVGCEEAGVFADGVTNVGLGPMRGDYAPGSGCL